MTFTPLGNRVVIKADRDEYEPEQMDSGLLVAKTLASAVQGSDPEDSWFVGTIVALGPLVNHLDARKFVLRHCDWFLAQDLNDLPYACDWVRMLKANLEALPPECPDPLKVGDRVTFSWASGQQLTIDDDRYLIMAATDVLAVLTEKDVCQTS